MRSLQSVLGWFRGWLGCSSDLDNHPVFNFVDREPAVNVPPAGRHIVGKGNAINSVWATDPLVATHEQVHETIFRETFDGRLLEMAVRVRNSHRAKGTVLPDRLSEFIRLSVAGSLDAHESAATYLSIKYLADAPTAEESETVKGWLNNLSPQYEKWYNDLADVIDPIFETTYVQYQTGWAVVKCAFSSRLILAGQDGTWENLRPSPAELPSARLKRLLKTLAAADDSLWLSLNERLVAFCQDYDITPWDFQCERGWRDYAKRRQPGIPVIDHVAWRVVYDWLRARS